jgi:hypothetical protein
MNKRRPAQLKSMALGNNAIKRTGAAIIALTLERQHIELRMKSIGRAELMRPGAIEYAGRLDTFFARRIVLSVKEWCNTGPGRIGPMA